MLLRGLSKLLFGLYEPKLVLRSGAFVRSKSGIPAPSRSRPHCLSRTTFASWRIDLDAGRALELSRCLLAISFGSLVRNFGRNDAKMWMGFMVLLSAHHFLIYAHQVADELERECAVLEATDMSAAEMPELAQVV